MLETKVLTSVTQVARPQWDALTQGHFFLSYGWLQSYEGLKTGAEELRLFLVYENECLLAVATGLLSTNHCKNRRGLDQTLLGKLAGPMSRFLISFKPALVMSPIEGRGQQCMLLAPTLKDTKKRQVMLAMLDEVEREAKKRKVSICFSDISDESRLLVDGLHSRGYIRTRNLPNSVLQTKWTSFEEYTRDQRVVSKKLRTNINRQIKRNVSAGVRIEVIADKGQLERHQQRIEQIILTTYFRHNGSNDFPFREGFIRTFWDLLGDNIIIVVAIKNGELVGARLVYVSGSERYCRLAGVDHDKTGGDFTYFNLIYYWTIADAIEAGCSELNYGVAMYTIKNRLGCVLQRNSLFYKPHCRFKEPLVGIWFKFHRLWFERKYCMDAIKKTNR